MKKLLLLVAVLAGAVLFTGCGDVEYGPQMSYEYVDVYNEDWKYVEEGGYLKCEVRMPIITRDVCEEGAVMVYWIHGDLQEVVPMVLWLDDGENGIYGEAISYAFRRGRITFYYNRDDLEYPDDLPGDLTFRVVVLE